MSDEAPLKDSGERRLFQTGAQRDRGHGKGRYDLIPSYPIYRLAVHMEKCAAKYEPRNWEKGMPLSEYINSMQRHLDKLKDGFEDEPHDDAVLWNIVAFMETKERIRRGILPAELDDLQTVYAGKEPW